MQKKVLFCTKIGYENTKYFNILEEEESIEIISQQTVKISISYDAIDKLKENSYIETKEFNEIINKLETINIDLKYPTTSFEAIYEQVLKLEKACDKQILINLYIEGITNTDMRLQNEQKILSKSNFFMDSGLVSLLGEKDKRNIKKIDYYEKDGELGNSYSFFFFLKNHSKRLNKY